MQFRFASTWQTIENHRGFLPRKSSLEVHGVVALNPHKTTGFSLEEEELVCCFVLRGIIECYCLTETEPIWFGCWTRKKLR